MMTIDVKINHKRVAYARIRNVSDLAALSNYTADVRERGSDETGEADSEKRFIVWKHKRRQSVWGLVQRVAEGFLAE